jgi:hypothetical protein
MYQQPPRPTWWSRNWKWLVPVVCVAGVVMTVVPLVAIYLFASFFLHTMTHTMKTSGGYQEALAAARANPAAVQALGTPIRDGWFPTGSVEGGGTSGSSDLAISVSGPKASGTLYVRATSSMGDWHLTMLVLQLKGTGERIDLLAGSNP